ncbi:hypothetical protein [Clostridioides difficile]|nr:hypothetical protein [Clostridioides difficile]
MKVAEDKYEDLNQKNILLTKELEELKKEIDLLKEVAIGVENDI